MRTPFLRVRINATPRPPRSAEMRAASRALLQLRQAAQHHGHTAIMATHGPEVPR